MAAQTLANLRVRLSAETKAYMQGMDAARKKLQSVRKDIRQFAFRAKYIGRDLTTALSLPLAAIGVAATKMASDAQEAANKFDVVMGGAADRVRERLRELHDTIPLTLHELEGLTAGVQDLLVPMGVARDEAASMSAQMVQLAGDIGSFNNVNPAQVLEAIKSALAGSSEPMRRFGVDTRVAALEAIALEHGLIRAGEEMDNAARAQAVLLAIQEDSTDAMGDAARTADSTANSIRFLKRNLKELSVTLGQEIVPLITPLINRASELTGRLEGISKNTKQWAIAIGAVTAALPLLLTLSAQFLITATSLAGLIGGPWTAAIVGLGAVLSALSAKWIKDQMEVAEWRSQMDRAKEATQDMTQALREMNEEKRRAVYADLLSGLGSLRSRQTMLENRRTSLQQERDEAIETLRASGVSYRDPGMTALRRRYEERISDVDNQLESVAGQIEYFEGMVVAASRGFFEASEGADGAGNSLAQLDRVLANVENPVIRLADSMDQAATSIAQSVDLPSRVERLERGKTGEKGYDPLEAQLRYSAAALIRSKGQMSGAQFGSMAGTVLGTALPGIGTAIGGAVGGVLGGLFDKEDEEKPAIRQLSAVERAQRETITAIREQTRDLLNPTNRLINAPTDFRVPAYNPSPGGTTNNYLGSRTTNLEVQLFVEGSSNMSPDEFKRAVDEAMADILEVGVATGGGASRL